jgi:hypothetical protein
MSTDKSLAAWQEWLETAEQIFSFDLWEQVNNNSKTTQSPTQGMIPLQITGIVLAYVSSMFLACIKEPEADVDRALQTIRDHMASLHAEIPNRKVKASVRKAYKNYVEELAPVFRDGSEMLYAAFSAYRQNAYDAQRDPNLLIHDAFRQLENGQDAEALHTFGQAMVLVLRGASPWAGWLSESLEVSNRWLVVMSLAQTVFPLIPLGEIAEERQHADERLQKLHVGESQEPSDEDMDDALSAMGLAPANETDELSEEEFMQQWEALVSRRAPLTDAEIEEMGERYRQNVDTAISILSDISLSQPEELDEDAIRSIMVFAHGLGVLNATGDASAANVLVELLPLVYEWPEAVDEIIWALEQMGSLGTQMLMDTVRYTLDDKKLAVAADELAQVGRGNEEVYQFLVTRYQEAHTAEEQRALITALGQMNDQRTMPLLVQALREPDLDEDVAGAVLSALTEMEAPITVDADAGSVTIQGYGEFQDVVPSWWAQESEEDEEEVDAIDLDELFPDDEEEGVKSDDPADLEDAGEDKEDALPPGKAAAFGPIHTEHVGRNDPCPCGSGKKFKYCHGRGL